MCVLSVGHAFVAYIFITLLRLERVGEERVLWGDTLFEGVCLLINERQDKHANNLIKFAAKTDPRILTWANFNRALINAN